MPSTVTLPDEIPVYLLRQHSSIEAYENQIVIYVRRLYEIPDVQSIEPFSRIL